MIIVGCDYHLSFQQIAFVDTETGELKEQRLEHLEGSGVPVHCVTGVGCGSVTETVTGPGVLRLSAMRRRRAPVEQGVDEEQVVGVDEELELELGVVGTGNRTLICPESDFMNVWPPAESVSVMVDAEEIFGASR